jgi:hypothetical protein
MFWRNVSLHAGNGSETLVTTHKITGITTGDHHNIFTVRTTNLKHS